MKYPPRKETFTDRSAECDKRPTTLAGTQDACGSAPTVFPIRLLAHGRQASLDGVQGTDWIKYVSQVAAWALCIIESENACFQSPARLLARLLPWSVIHLRPVPRLQAGCCCSHLVGSRELSQKGNKERQLFFGEVFGEGLADSKTPLQAWWVYRR